MATDTLTELRALSAFQLAAQSAFDAMAPELRAAYIGIIDRTIVACSSTQRAEAERRASREAEQRRVADYERNHDDPVAAVAEVMVMLEEHDFLGQEDDLRHDIVNEAMGLWLSENGISVEAVNAAKSEFLSICV